MYIEARDRSVGAMPSMDGGGAGGGHDCPAVMTMSFHDLEKQRPSAVVLPRLLDGGDTPTDSNGNNLPPITYADMKGIDSLITSRN